MKHEKVIIDLSAFDVSPEKQAAGKAFMFKVKMIFGIYASIWILLLIMSIFSRAYYYIWVIWFTSPLILLFIWGMFLKDKGRKPNQQLMKFAVDNNLKYELEVEHEPIGIIAQVGNDNHYSIDELRGNLYGYDYRLLWHKFTIGSGKSEKRMEYAVIEIQLPKKLPHIFIDSRKNNDIFDTEILNFFQDESIIKLEGDFSNYFNLYGLRTYAAEVLTIMNPSFMASLIDYDLDFEIEFKDETAYIYFPNQFIAYDQPLVKIYLALEFLILELQKQLDTFRYSPVKGRVSTIPKSVYKQLGAEIL